MNAGMQCKARGALCSFATQASRNAAMRPAFIFPFGLTCLPASALADMISDFLNTPQIQVQRREVVQAAIRRFKQGESRKSGLVDALNAKIASSEGCSSTVALDKATVRAAGMTLVA